MKILLVEDDREKAAQVSSVICSIQGIQREDISIHPDITSAKKALTDHHFDLLVLDIQIPNRYDEEPRPLGGIDFLREISEREKYHLPAHIIGLTAFEDSYTPANEFFLENGWVLVKFSDTDSQWQIILRNYASYIFEHQNRSSSTSTAEESFNYDLAIICALPQVEFESIASLPFNFAWSPAGRGMQFLDGTYQGKEKLHKVAAMFAPQMGMTPCAVLTLSMIYELRPRYLAMSGIAAGVYGKANFGDILVADQSWDYGSGKISIENGTQLFSPDPHPISLAPELKEKFQQLSLDHKITDSIMNSWPGDKPETRLQVHVGPIASGSAVVSDPSVITSILQQNRKLLGLEMENYGFFHASAHAPHPRPVAFSAKSVSDMADDKKNDKYQRYAAYTSAQLLYHFASHYLLH